MLNLLWSTYIGNHRDIIINHELFQNHFGVQRFARRTWCVLIIRLTLFVSEFNSSGTGTKSLMKVCSIQKHLSNNIIDQQHLDTSFSNVDMT